MSRGWSAVRVASLILEMFLALAITGRALAAEQVESRQASGVKVGEVTGTSAIVWTRVTKNAMRNNSGFVFTKPKDKKTSEAPVTLPLEQLDGACPGAVGRVRLRYGPQSDLADAKATDWFDVSEKTDFTHHFRLNGLSPGVRYHCAVETTGPGGSPVHGAVRGQFETAPDAGAPGSFRFCVMTCQAYHDRDHPDGHNIYPSMLALEPKFVSLTGDLVYYDSDPPTAVTPALARYHWQRMFSLPRQAELLRNVSSYWLKDDHDTLRDDTFPGSNLGDLTFAEGQQIFREQTPLDDDAPGYRTFRWGRDLQIWFTDGRDHRSPNKMPDGPDKTIWGKEQKEWFRQTVKASDATWKLLISPTPLVGPDRPTKNDNHSNAGYKHEGDELRGWLREHAAGNLFVVCGDRHWQYHSVHPETGLNEFSVGAASDAHAGGTPGENPAYHRFHRVKGGFLSVALSREGATSTIRFELRDVLGEVVYAWSRSADVGS
ncbi:MAG TPA: alkaline phosphatase D family protein [Planctomycetaceae bacterium]|nr:alkaline phosphatase D family protein [Planctomycetaceae bacterium]